MDDDLRRRSEAYLDGIFGPGAGAKHSQFLDHIQSDTLREMLHRGHAVEADTQQLSHAENYLIGMCVLCATRTYGPASMFAMTLMHLGVPKAKILDAVARLGLWVGVVPAAEAAGHIQRAIREYEQKGLEAMRAWFPEPGPR